LEDARQDGCLPHRKKEIPPNIAFYPEPGKSMETIFTGVVVEEDHGSDNEDTIMDQGKMGCCGGFTDSTLQDERLSKEPAGSLSMANSTEVFGGY